MSKETIIGNRASRAERTGLLQRQWLQGETITHGSITVTPISRRVSLGLPGWLRKDQGLVLICQRPAALIVKRGESTRTIPIHDLQQIILFTMFGLTALCLFILTRPKQKEKANDQNRK